MWNVVLYKTVLWRTRFCTRVCIKELEVFNSMTFFTLSFVEPRWFPCWHRCPYIQVETSRNSCSSIALGYFRKKNKVVYHWPFVWWQCIPITTGQWCEKRVHVLTSSFYRVLSRFCYIISVDRPQPIRQNSFDFLEAADMIRVWNVYLGTTCECLMK